MMERFSPCKDEGFGTKKRIRLHEEDRNDSCPAVVTPPVKAARLRSSKVRNNDAHKSDLSDIPSNRLDFGANMDYNEEDILISKGYSNENLLLSESVGFVEEDLPEVLRVVATYAYQTGREISQVWNDARIFALSACTDFLKSSIQMEEDVPGFVRRDNVVGISYIVPSESVQEGCKSYDPLPHLTIRPSMDFFADNCNESLVEDNLEVLMSQNNLVSRVETLDDMTMKTYLSDPSSRNEILKNHQGTMLISNLAGIIDELSDKGFACIHFVLEEKKPFIRIASLVSEDNVLFKANVHVVLTLKKGVGGTSGMKSEVKKFESTGLLNLMLGDDPQNLLDYYKNVDLRLENGQEGLGEPNDNQLLPGLRRLALSTSSCRIEMFIDREKWKNIERVSRSALAMAFRQFGDHISNNFAHINWERLVKSIQQLEVPTSIGLDPALARRLRSTLDASFDFGKPVNEEYESRSLNLQAKFIKYHTLLLILMNEMQGSHPQPPLYLISTRECFSCDIISEDTKIVLAGSMNFIRKNWYVKSKEAPSNYDTLVEKMRGKGSNRGIEAAILDGMVCKVAQNCSEEDEKDEDGYFLPLGITTYNGIFSPRQLDQIETKCDLLHTDAQQGIIPKECYHSSESKNGHLKRTKYFFGSRYLWSRDQLASPAAKIARGIRVDVPEPPKWMIDFVEHQMQRAQIVKEGFVNAIALNMYHDGSEGIQNHYDDSKRFQQPIYSLRLFSDSRLSFGTQLYGFTNGLFCVPMPRGCVTVMHDGGYAANGVKHCVRPIDMTGKSAAMILRQVNQKALETATKYYWEETLMMLASLTLLPTRPERLLWNPLFEGKLSSRPGSSKLLDLQRVERKERKQIALVMKRMIKSVQNELKMGAEADMKGFITVSGMIRRIVAAERLGLSLVDDASYEIFRLVDDMVSFHELPGLRMKRRVKRN